MTIMNWDASLDVGVDQMNREHQGLLNLMNRLHDARDAGKTGKEVLDILDALGAATVQHFKDEEDFMERSGYPKFKTHKLIHEDLLKKFTGYAEAAHASHGKLEDGFFFFLKHWLTAHIKGIDMQYGPNAQKLAS